MLSIYGFVVGCVDVAVAYGGGGGGVATAVVVNVACCCYCCTLSWVCVEKLTSPWLIS